MFGRMLSADSITTLTVALLAGTAVVDAASPAQIFPREALANRGLVPRSVTVSAASTGTPAANRSATATQDDKVLPTVEPIKKNNGTNNATSVYQHKGLNTSLNPWFNASGAWLTKSCSSDDYSGKTIDPDGAKIWKEADADTALSQLMDAWNSRPDEVKDWTFSRFVWSVFNVTGGNNEGSHVNCADPQEPICGTTIKCDPSIGITPAGYLIVNSMVAMHRIYQMQHDALSQAYNSLNDGMQLVVDNFDWTPKPDESLAIFKEVLGFLTTALGAVSGGTISEAFTAIKAFGKLAEAEGNTIKTVASTGLGLTNNILATIPAPTAQGDIVGDLNAMLQTGYNGLTQGVTAMLETLMDAKGNDNQTLFKNFLGTGLLLDYFNQNTDTTDVIANKAISMMYGQVIPAAWGLSTEKLKPFILRVDAKDMKCKGDLPSDLKSDIFDKDVATEALWCDDAGNSFWLLNGRHQDICMNRFGCPGQNKPPFGMLPGGNKTNLDGGDHWGHLSLDQIIRSAWGGFMANNKQNGYGIPKGTSQEVAANMTLQGSNGLPMAGGVLTPGYINLTICLDYKEALKNLRDPDKDKPICGKSPSVGDAQTAMNAPGSYTPGWCGVHVEQFQRGEGNENPLSVYQFSANVYDGASLLIGDAIKQPAFAPLAVKATLPYQLIIAPGKGDDDPVSFWYGDQYWTSDSKENHCAVGSFDGGSRKMDCGFNCPVHADSPPVSATKDHPLPGAPTPAAAGPETFVNTWITRSPSATPTGTGKADPPPKPKPTYATGQCGVHVRQHQKNEKGQNPTNDFQLEVTLFDGKGKAIGASGQAPAPAGKAVTVAGLVDPFTVTAYAVDDDGLWFTFDNDKWWSNSTRCGVGKYDSGHRDMDCGFSC